MDLNQQLFANESNQTAETPRSISRVRRMVLKFVLPTIGALGLSFVTLVFGHLVSVHRNNHAYNQIQYGDQLDQVVARMGEAQEVTRFQYPSNHRIVKRYTYYVYPILIGENQVLRYRWQIDVDESDRVVGTFYSDDAC